MVVFPESDYFPGGACWGVRGLHRVQSFEQRIEILKFGFFFLEILIEKKMENGPKKSLIAFDITIQKVQSRCKM